MEFFGLKQRAQTSFVVVDELDIASSLLDGIKCRCASLADLYVDGGLEPIVSL